MRSGGRFSEGVEALGKLRTGKDPHPQDKVQPEDVTKDPPARSITRPLHVHLTRTALKKAILGLSQDRTGPWSSVKGFDFLAPSDTITQDYYEDYSL